MFDPWITQPLEKEREKQFRTAFSNFLLTWVKGTWFSFLIPPKNVFVSMFIESFQCMEIYIEKREATIFLLNWMKRAANSKLGKSRAELRIERKPEARKINTSDCLGEKMCLLFLQIEDALAFFKVTSKCSSWNYVCWKATKFFMDVQFKLLHSPLHLFPFLQQIRHTRNNFRYPPLSNLNSGYQQTVWK